MTSKAVRYVGFTTKGLEDVASDELHAAVPTATITSDRPKMLRIGDVGSPRSLRGLRCFDDVVVEAAAPSSGEPLDEDELAEGIATARRLIAGVRPVGDELSITVSAIRRHKGDVEAIKEQVVEIARTATGLQPRGEGRSTFDLRLQIDADELLVGVRLFDHSLAGLRSPRAGHRAGGLRPTIAAAMVRLAAAGSPAPLTIWDPFCGSGTILSEAAWLGHEVFGSDIDPEAVAVTINNLGSDVGHETVKVADALNDQTWNEAPRYGCLVTNLPWNKQIPVASRTSLYRAVGRQFAALSNRGHPVVVLTTDPGPIVAAARRDGLKVDPTLRRLGFAGQTPTLLSNVG